MFAHNPFGPIDFALIQFVLFLFVSVGQQPAVALAETEHANLMLLELEYLSSHRLELLAVRDITMLCHSLKQRRHLPLAALVHAFVVATTGAAAAVGLVLPEVKGKLTGYSMRVPTSTVSVVDLAVITEKQCDVESVNRAMKRAANGALKGILRYEEDPLVSIDFKGSPYSSIFDPALTQKIGDNHLKVVSWYDNEMGYSHRMVDLAVMIGKKL